MLKAIIFDADNTLYKVNKETAYDLMFSVIEKETGKTKKSIKRAWDDILRSILNSSGSKSIVSRNREHSLAILLDKFGISDKGRIRQITDAALSIFWRQILLDLDFAANTKRTLNILKKKYSLVVASDEFRKFLEAKLNHVLGDWKEYFDFVICAEDAGEHKPSQNYCKLALDRLKIKPEEALLVGDSWERDIAPAKMLGTKTALVADKQEGKPDYFIRSIAELPSLKL